MLIFETIGGLVYLAIGFRYIFSLVYPDIIREKLEETEKVFNNAIGRWEEPKKHTSSEGSWEDVTRAVGWGFIWMWVWPAWLLVNAGDHARKHIAKHNAHRIATTLTMTKRNPRIRRIDLELRESHIKQLEREAGIRRHDEA